MIDIRFPIGLLFAIIGGLLLTYGLSTMSHPELYQKSLGINVNLWAGCLMAMFGLIMIALSSRGSESNGE
jgi:hypothetical protein